MSPTDHIHVWVVRSELTKVRASGIVKMASLLDEHIDVTVHYIDGHEPSTMTASQVSAVASSEKCGVERFDALRRPLTLRHVSNALKHIAALRSIAESVDDQPHLVVEDDIVYGDEMGPTLAAVLRSPERSPMVMLGLPFGKSDSKPSPGPHFESLVNTFNVVPSCESYLVTPECARALLKFMEPIRFTTNVAISYAIHAAGIDATVTVPNVFMDGSKLGSHIGTIEANNPLIYNPDFHKVRALVTDPGSSEDDVRSALRDAKFSKHPEFVALAAALDARCGRYKDAEALFAGAYEVLRGNGAVVNGTSSILQSYIRLFRDIQTFPQETTQRAGGLQTTPTDSTR